MTHCYPSSQQLKYSGADDVYCEDLLSWNKPVHLVDMMLGLLISLQSFTMNRHHAEREMTSPAKSKLNAP